MTGTNKNLKKSCHFAILLLFWVLKKFYFFAWNLHPCPILVDRTKLGWPPFSHTSLPMKHIWDSFQIPLSGTVLNLDPLFSVPFFPFHFWATFLVKTMMKTKQSPVNARGHDRPWAIGVVVLRPLSDDDQLSHWATVVHAIIMNPLKGRFTSESVVLDWKPRANEFLRSVSELLDWD